MHHQIASARRCRRWHARLAGATLAALFVAGCDLTVTNDRPAFDDLAEEEQGAVETVLSELTEFETQAEPLSGISIAEIIDREKIDVSFDDAIFVANFGDGLVHVSIWENLSATQQRRVAEWFSAAQFELARQIYEKFFYQFMAVNQGAKQFMYEANGAPWVFDNRSLFSVERDAVRTALAHYAAAGRQEVMWGFLTEACEPVLAQFAPRYAETYSRSYLFNNLRTLASPDDPTGYMYYTCRWIEEGQAAARPLAEELAWLATLSDR